jgi:hypothetical protein
MLTWLPPLQVVLELRGKEFGDFVFGVGDDFLISRKFKEIYCRVGLTGLTGLEPVEVVKIKSRRRKRPDPPPYFRAVLPYNRTAVDIEASGFEWLEPPTCMECRVGNVIRWKRVVIEERTWTGEDIFAARGLADIIVSERFKQVCESNAIKNAIFIPAESYARDFYPGLKDPSELKS